MHGSEVDLLERASPSIEDLKQDSADVSRFTSDVRSEKPVRINERTVTHLREGTVADVVSVAPEELAPNGLRRDRISLPTVVRILEMLGYTARQERLVVLVAVHGATRRRRLTASSQRLRMVIAHVSLRVLGCVVSLLRLAPIVAIPWASGSGVNVARGE